MKTCPFCKAEIEENARFCLYCMTSLEEKQVIDTPKETHKRWLVILAAVFVFVMMVGGFWLGFGQNKATPISAGTSESRTTSVGSSTGFTTADNEAADSSSKPTTTKNSRPSFTSRSPIAGNTDPSENKTQNHTQTNGNAPSSGNAALSVTTSSAGNTTSKTAPSGTSASSSTGSAVTKAIYAYRKAQKGDDFSLSYPIPENAIVITGVTTPSSDGSYAIPESIDGHTVIAIMGAAFSSNDIKDSVKKVVIPSTVKTIWNDAFAGCYHLTDIYFCGNAIYTEARAFPDASKRTGILTIHCSADCHDRNLRLYKNSAGYYDAQYEEWNG